MGEGTSRLAELKRRRRRNQRVGILAGAISALLIGGIALMVGSPEPPRQADESDKPPRVVEETVAAKNAFQEAAAWARDASPTHGPPIDLKMMPAGCRIVINLHPAELWREGSLGHEFRYCLGPLNEWLEKRITDLTTYHPREIERLQIGLIPGQRGVPPEVAAVVHLVNPFASKSQFLLKLQAQRSDDYGYPVYLTADRVYLIRDNRTFAIAPRLAASELVESMNQSAVTSVGVQELLLHSDRNRHVTVVFEPIDIRNFQDVLFPEIALPFINRVLDWINEEDVEAVLWSFHLSPDRFYHEVLFRNRNIIREHRLAQVIEEKVQQLPYQMLENVRYMNPTLAGRRQLIGRLPAMLKVAAMASRVGVGSRYVQLVTVLHTDRAAPNLALAALLAWDEATRTDFTKPPSAVASTGSRPQRQPVRERLKKPIDIEFTRTPLQEAFQYIADECNVGVYIEGDALKLAGMTKNMPQTFKLGTAPGWKGIKTIVDRYKNEGMCIVVDEANDRFIVTTVDFAKQKGQQPESLDNIQ